MGSRTTYELDVRGPKATQLVSLTAPFLAYISRTMEKINVIAALAALAQENRLDAFRLLVEAGEAGLPAGRIAEQLGLPNNTLSFHLDRLRNAGLVAQRRDGRNIIYAAQYSAVNGLVGYLTENCCRGVGDRSDCTTPLRGKRARLKESAKLT
jgi:ArsR family transcriptional regulator, arsenate/arsenite/antimonite-responsive transcriptional repressor